MAMSEAEIRKATGGAMGANEYYKGTLPRDNRGNFVEPYEMIMKHRRHLSHDQKVNIINTLTAELQG